MKNFPLSRLIVRNHLKDGWICSLGKALGLSSSELAEKVLVTEQTLLHLEEDIYLLPYLNQIAAVFGGRFQYVLIPDKTPLPRDRSLVVVP